MKASEKKSGSEEIRRRAEGLLKNKKSEINSQLSEADTIKLMHELQVHQIELELQNEELILAKESAENASEKYTELYDFAPNGYFTLTRDAEIIELNLAGAKILGKERSLLLNKNLALFISKNSKDVFIHFIERLFSTRVTETCEVLLPVRSGIQSFIYLTGVVINENHCFVSAIDITPQKRLETELIFAKEKAEENDHLKTAFLQNMSHEIRTPLNAIKGFASLLVKKHDDQQKLEKFTKIIDQRCDDLLNIINDILDTAKIESGQLEVHMEECDLFELFDDLTTQFTEYQEQLNKNHIQFSIQTFFNPNDSVILTDKVKLKQILVNLITNAFKFTNKGKIECGCNVVNNTLLFYVSDTGIGIPEDKQKAVFDSFTQLSHPEKMSIGGTGLGLSIVKGLTNMLGGEIVLESEPDKGSKFSFTIPYKLQNEPVKTIDVRNEYQSFHFPDKTILIVEDEVYNAEFIKEILNETGIHILFAETGKEAVEIASEQYIDLVLMDIQLPDMDGYEASQQIRQQKPELKIIAQTAYASDGYRKDALNKGLNDYISKPINSELLLKMISRHLS